MRVRTATTTERTWSALVVLACAIGASARAAGQDASTALDGGAAPASEPVIEVSVRDKQRIISTQRLDPTASGTSLDLTKRVTMPRSLGDVVREAPGSLVMSTGGLGAFSALSLRGAANEETLVLVDEIPLVTPDGGAFDLSLLPAELFQQVNVFRGGAPTWLGSGAIGGVMQLVPHRGQRNGMNVALGAGNFGTYQLNAGSEVSLKNGLTSHSQLVVRGTRGDYPYADDRGTRFDSSDDREFRLKNADYADAAGLQDISIPLAKGRLHLFALGLVRGGGFPGPAAQPTPRVRRENSRAIGAAAYTLEGGSSGQFARKLQLLATGAFGADRFVDLYGQLGTSKRTAADNHSFRTFARAAGSLELTRWLEGTALGTYAYDRFSPHDSFAFPQSLSSTRHTTAGSAELNAHGALGGVRFELRPSVRLEWSDTSLGGTRNFLRAYPSERRVLAPTARVGAAIEPASWLAFSGSIATGTRLPSIFELFGDAGLVLPNLELKPVKSTTYDGGITSKLRYGPVHGLVELRGFYQERRDSIAMFGTSQFQLGYQNVAAVRQYGFESRLNSEWKDWAHLSGSVTWMETESALGMRLPFRPRLLAYARPELRIPIERAFVSDVRVASEVWHRGLAYYDNSNLTYTDPCTKLGFGAAVVMFSQRLRFAARLDDALDARCTDLLGYPLQGRSLFFTLSYREDPEDAS